MASDLAGCDEEIKTEELARIYWTMVLVDTLVLVGAIIRRGVINAGHRLA
jgi:hypothetical protein